MTGKYNMYQIWRDFITLAACTISNHADMGQWQEREDMYMDAIKKYEKEEANKFAEMLALVVTGLSGGKFGDFLGETYMQLELGNDDVGQYFTPYHISKLMAGLIDIEEKKDGTVVANDPAAGSGGLIIAYADMMKGQNINYQEKLRVICNDLDNDVVKMCYIQLSLLGIDAVVYQGDTLTMKMNEAWHTPMHFINIGREKRKGSDEKVKRMTSVIRELEANETKNETVSKVPKVALGQADIFDFI